MSFRVLLVDDDKNIHDLLNLSLSNLFDYKKQKSLKKNLKSMLDETQNDSEIHDFQVLSVFQAHEAIDLLEKKEMFDLIILDVVMPPGESGVSVLKYMKEKNIKIKTVLSTAYFSNDKTEIENIVKDLAKVLLLDKPYSLSKFTNTVKYMLDYDYQGEKEIGLSLN